MRTHRRVEVTTEYLEVVILVADRKAICGMWRKVGCRCLRKPWAYHFVACPVAQATNGAAAE